MAPARAVLLWSLLLAATLALAASAAAKERRVALVIGNGAYVSVPRLTNPANDATLVAETLREGGFELVGGGPLLDLDAAKFLRAVQNFGRDLEGADVALFYYSGHGIQVSGVNWLVPVDANPTRERDLDFQMVDANLVLRQMEGARTKLNIVILDACRNNPFGGRGFRATAGGLAEMQAPEGTLISYATQPGNVAADGAGTNSPYTVALIDAIRTPGLDIFRVFNRVGLDVKRSTSGSQIPWLASSPIAGDFYFFGAPTAVVLPQVSGRPSAPPAAPASPNRFDGMWRVLLTCDQTQDGTPGYTKAFLANVAAGRLHGSYGRPGAPDSMNLDGTIEADGAATLYAAGRTGTVRNAGGQVSDSERFTYHVTAHFTAAHGEGRRVEARPCTMTFQR